MARRWRSSEAGYVYHVLNLAVGRATLFRKPAAKGALSDYLQWLTARIDAAAAWPAAQGSRKRNLTRMALT